MFAVSDGSDLSLLERMWDTLHTAFDRSSGTLDTVGGGGWGRCIDWQRPVGGTTMTTDAATSSVKTKHLKLSNDQQSSKLPVHQFLLKRGHE